MIDRAPTAGLENNGDSEIRPAPAFAAAARRFVLFSLVGIGVGLAVMLIVMRQANYDPTPALSPEQFYAARENWKTHPVADYDIQTKVSGPQPATYRVEVRGGQAVAAWRNGQPLVTQRTLGTWSIPGMFSTISRDVEALEQAQAKHQQQPLILRAAFNADYGYPEKYRRIDNGSRKGSDSISVTWDVTEFRVISEAATADSAK